VHDVSRALWSRSAELGTAYELGGVHGLEEGRVILKLVLHSEGVVGEVDAFF